MMNYPAASSGVSTGIFIIAPRRGEFNLYPPQEDSSASGGLKVLVPPAKVYLKRDNGTRILDTSDQASRARYQ
jgi:hypothetical protein